MRVINMHDVKYMEPIVCDQWWKQSKSDNENWLHGNVQFLVLFNAAW